MPIDPREIRPQKSKLFEVIETDRLCRRCRYNLKGLPLGGKCPECGAPIGAARRGKRFTDNLTDAPIAYLKTLAFGLVLLAIFSIASTFAFYFLGLNPSLVWAGVAAFTAVGWWIGVYIATAPRQTAEDAPRDGVLDSGWLRIANRSIQASWILAVVFWVLVLRLPPGSMAHTAAWYTQYALQLIGLFGLVPFAVQLSSLSDWAGDTSLSERFRVVAWAMAVCGVGVVGSKLSVGAGGVLSGLLFLAAVWGTGLQSVIQLVFLYSLFQLANNAIWAVRNSNTAYEVNRRLQERRDKHAMELAERTAAAIALQEHGPPPKRTDTRPLYGENKMERPKGGVDPYAVEPEPPAEDPAGHP